jgi:hypothetical protein
MIRRLYETLTGRPWMTVRSCTTEYGPPPGARYAAQLAVYSDAQLICHGHDILARLRQQQHKQHIPATTVAACPPAVSPVRTAGGART